MSIRLRKFLSLFILVPGLAAYCFLAIALADRIPDFWAAQLAYFMIAGLAWAYPASRLIRWANGAARPKLKETPH
jgi:hypothetical protein